jgi:hypothetical protein
MQEKHFEKEIHETFVAEGRGPVEGHVDLARN